MNENIFREYDIRGVVENDFKEEVVRNIAKAFATCLIEKDCKSCVIGYDARLSRDFLYNLFREELLGYGINVIFVGMVTSPILYFAQIKLGCDAAVMITGSHNPADMNGFKMIIKDQGLYGKDIQKLKNIILDNSFYPLAKIGKKGEEEQLDIIPAYYDYLKENIKAGSKKLKIVIDGGNGTGGEFAAEIFEYFGAEVTKLYTKPDGNFPNHHPDPTVPENMTDLISKVKELKADLGIGYDGDGDRLGVVTNEGKLLFGDQLMILFAREILKRKPGSTIIGEVKCSKTLYDDIAKNGGNPIMWKAGHSLIKAKMKEVGAELGGEVSGHIFFKDRFFGHDDALYASLRLYEILTTQDKTITDLMADVKPTIMTPEIRTECSDEYKFELVKKVTNYFKENGYQVNDVDGVRVIFEDGFGLVRASNTQPAITQRYEAFTEERVKEIEELIQSKISEFDQ